MRCAVTHYFSHLFLISLALLSKANLYAKNINNLSSLLNNLLPANFSLYFPNYRTQIFCSGFYRCSIRLLVPNRGRTSTSSVVVASSPFVTRLMLWAALFAPAEASIQISAIVMIVKVFLPRRHNHHYNFLNQPKIIFRAAFRLRWLPSSTPLSRPVAD